MNRGSWRRVMVIGLDTGIGVIGKVGAEKGVGGGRVKEVAWFWGFA
jgi:hypothetical protein